MGDFSTYITIKNNLNSPLQLDGSAATLGSWKTAPPSWISARSSSVQFQCLHASGSNGSEGWFIYRTNSEIENLRFKINFADPYRDDNYVRTNGFSSNLYTLSYRARSSNGAWWDNTCPASGHPVEVEITISYKTVPDAYTLHSLRAQSDYRIKSSSGFALPLDNTVWQQGGINNDGDYSANPILVKTNNQTFLKINLDISNSKLTDVPIKIKGTKASGNITFQSKVITPTSTGIMMIDLMLSGADLSKALQSYGDFKWSIEAANQSFQLPDTTRLEMYWISNSPDEMFKAGVWVKVYRKIFTVLSAGMTTDQIATSISKQCFDGFSKKYDTVYGAAKYGPGPDGGFFELKNYYNNTNGALCNCYDQAGLVQVQLGAMGISSYWVYMTPFGFINQTNLIGVGQCNNPFFSNPVCAPEKIVDINNPKRSAFGNHAFVAKSISNNSIIDACQGPFIGDKTLATYVSEGIDSKTGLYKKFGPPNNVPGKATDAKQEPGIVSLILVKLLASKINTLEMEALKPVIDFEELYKTASAEFLLVDIDQLLQFALQDYTYETGSIVLSDSGVIKTGTYVKDQKRIQLKIHVATNGITALRFMERFLSGFSNPPSTIFERGPAALGPVALQHQEAPEPMLLWTQQNIFFVLDGLECSYDELYQISMRIKEGSANTQLLDKHNIPDSVDMHVNLSNPEVRVNDSFKVNFSGEMDDMIICDTADTTIEIDSTGRDYYHYRAVAPGNATLQIFVVQPKYYFLLTHTVNITIK
ncbi:hypothetical protein CLV59_107110 [Chitinophaga dinghuensis]|uniref:Uncharacterized protein n=1 Tax=Chitinophaga dinghuensis TaxID=1539050 RepID=A0A327VQL6_9BACT|nr:hypothetical protein [Chitinophaga dinghuensis]RAJ77343.1 hypothetical protein CLV59_107110 [Chitinophaga dinghuensis]